MSVHYDDYEFDYMFTDNLYDPQNELFDQLDDPFASDVDYNNYNNKHEEEDRATTEDSEFEDAMIQMEPESPIFGIPATDLFGEDSEVMKFEPFDLSTLFDEEEKKVEVVRVEPEPEPFVIPALAGLQFFRPPPPPTEEPIMNIPCPILGFLPQNPVVNEPIQENVVELDDEPLSVDISIRPSRKYVGDFKDVSLVKELTTKPYKYLVKITTCFETVDLRLTNKNIEMTSDLKQRSCVSPGVYNTEFEVSFAFKRKYQQNRSCQFEVVLGTVVIGESTTFDVFGRKKDSEKNFWNARNSYVPDPRNKRRKRKRTETETSNKRRKF